MRWTPAFVPVLIAVLACGGGGENGGGGSESSSAGDEEGSTTVPVDANPLVCDPATAVEFPDDEVGFGFVSVDAVRVATEDGAVLSYDLYLHGDDGDLTQIIIRFTGTPQVGLLYAASGSSAAAMVELFPGNGSLTLTGGTIKYTAVGTEQDDLLDAEVRLQLNTGRLQGCISAPLIANG